jgi:hypothetical protein
MKTKIKLAGLALLALTSTLSSAAPLGTAFTYQGRLQAGGAPANGVYDLQCVVHDAEFSGSQIGATFITNGIGVSNGLFTTMLDFGPDVFDGNARWLIVAVRTNGDGGFTVLSPRQPLAPAPHALYARAAGTATSATTAGSADSVSAANITGTVSLAQLPGPVLTNNQTGVTLGGTFSGALRLNDGDIYLRGGSDTNHGLGWFGGGKTFAGFSANGPVLYGFSGGILGVTSGTAKPTLTWGSSYVDVYGNLGVTNTLFADTGGQNSGALKPGLTFGGSSSGEGIASKRTSGGNQYGLDFYVNSIARLSITHNGNVGINKNNPATLLDVNGTVTATSFSGSGAGLTGLPTGSLADNSVTAAKLASDANSLGKVTAGVMSMNNGIATFNGNARIQNHDLYLFQDAFHGVGWYGAGKLFSGVNVDGPVLYGHSGGGLGTTSGTTNLALHWTSGGININGALRLNNGGIHLRGGSDTNHGVGWFGAGKPFAGFLPDGPVLYGFSGGILGVAGVTPKATLTWGSSYVDVYGNLGVTNTLLADTSGQNNGALKPGLTFGGSSSGEGIASKRTSGGNQHGLDLFTGYSARLSIVNNGNVGLGRQPTANRLEVEGTASKTTAGDWAANSDARIKTDVATITNALDTLDRVRLVNFRYTDDYRAAHPGIEDRAYLNVVAQEFREIFPDSVKSSGEKLADGSEILQVDTYPLTIYSAAAIQELRRELQEQRDENAQLKHRLEKLEALLLPLTGGGQ